MVSMYADIPIQSPLFSLEHKSLGYPLISGCILSHLSTM